jgi:hypothetical protein
MPYIFQDLTGRMHQPPEICSAIFTLEIPEANGEKFGFYRFGVTIGVDKSFRWTDFFQPLRAGQFCHPIFLLIGE